MRTTMVIVSASGALPLLGIAVVSPTFVKPGALPLLTAITCFTAVTVILAAAAGRLTDRQFAILGAGGMLGVALSAYVIADPAATRAVTAMLAIVPAISASASPPRITTTLTTVAVLLATAVTATDLDVTGAAVTLIALGAAATTVVTPVLVIGGLTRSLHAVNTRLQQLADTDPLTELYNRRGMLAPTRALLDSARHRTTGLRAALIDIDHFKTVNDTHGHTAGNRALTAVADAVTAVLAEHAPTDSVLARIGGEEFLLLTHTDLDPGLETRIQNRIRADTPVTVSIGTVTAHLTPHTGPVAPGTGRTDTGHTDTVGAAHTDASMSPADAVEAIVDAVSHAADDALYRAKTAGRDCIRRTDPISVTWRPHPTNTAGTYTIVTSAAITRPTAPTPGGTHTSGHPRGRASRGGTERGAVDRRTP